MDLAELVQQLRDSGVRAIKLELGDAPVHNVVMPPPAGGAPPHGASIPMPWPPAPYQPGLQPPAPDEPDAPRERVVPPDRFAATGITPPDLERLQREVEQERAVALKEMRQQAERELLERDQGAA